MKRKNFVVVGILYLLHGVVLASERGSHSNSRPSTAMSRSSQRTVASVAPEYNQNMAMVPAYPTQAVNALVPLQLTQAEALRQQANELERSKEQQLLGPDEKVVYRGFFQTRRKHRDGSTTITTERNLVTTRRGVLPEMPVTVNTATSPLPTPGIEELPQNFDAGTQMPSLPASLPASQPQSIPGSVIPSAIPSVQPSQHVSPEPATPTAQNIPGRPDEVMTRGFRPVSSQSHQSHNSQSSTPARTSSNKTPIPAGAIVGTQALRRQKSTDSGSLFNAVLTQPVQNGSMQSSRNGSRPTSQMSLARQEGYRDPSSTPSVQSLTQQLSSGSLQAPSVASSVASRSQTVAQQMQMTVPVTEKTTTIRERTYNMPIRQQQDSQTAPASHRSSQASRQAMAERGASKQSSRQPSINN